MIASLLLLACAAPTVDVGWQQLEDGAYEYIIQIEPDQLESMRAGRDILSDLPPALRSIRRYRITVGNAPLPHEGVPPELIGAPRLERPDEAPRGSVGDPADNVVGAPLLISPRTSLPTSVLPGPGDEAAPSFQTGPAIVEAEVAIEKATTEPVTADEKAALPQSPTFVVAAEEDSPVPDSPEPFEAPTDSRPLVEQASTTAAKPAPSPAETEVAKPTLEGEVVPDNEPIGWPLSAAVVGLFVSLGANIYMTWVTLGTRYRYRELIARMRRQSAKSA